MANSKAEERNRQGYQVDRINRRKIQAGVEKRRGGHQGPVTQPHNQPWSKKERKTYIEIKKGKEPRGKI